MRFKTRTAFVNLIKNGALMVGSILVIILLLEVAMQIFYVAPPTEMDEFRLSTSEFYRRDAVLGWIPRKNVQGEHNRAGSFSTTFSTNSKGLRDREYELKKPEGITRIIVIGDSFTWGFGVSDDEIYTERLEAMLTDTEVINLGVTGYGLRQEITYLEREGLQYDPDIVIAGFCMNDIYRPHDERAGKGDSIAANDEIEGPTTSQRAGSKNIILALKKFLARSSVLYRFLVDRINTNKTLINALVSLRIKDSLVGFEGIDINLMPALKEYPKILETSWEETRSELLELERLTRASGIRLVIAVVPSVQSIQQKTFEHAIAYTAFDPEDFDLGKPYRLLEEFSREHDIELVNPFRRFQHAHNEGSRLYLKREMHLNATGHDLLARTIAEQLL